MELNPAELLQYQDRKVEQQPDAVMALEQALARKWLDKTPDEFEAEVTKYLSNVKSERFDVLYTELIYKPMLEVFNLLAANDFRIFVCSLGGREFMRVIAVSAWGIRREHVIGTAYSYEYKGGKIRRGDKLLGGLHWARAKCSTYSLTPGGCRPLQGGIPTWTSICSSARGSRCS